ncbi:MAG: hypothetical protein K6T26_08865, partial [Alicyclobacillus sp.]|nr:hypothetical protein [Alicyclobacillus sp.]
SIPDVVWQSGYPGVTIKTDHGWSQGGGTSLSAPLWAGLWVLGDAAHLNKYHAHLPSDANEVLYSIAKAHPNAFNRPKSSPVGQWGLGTPNPTDVIAALSQYVPDHQVTNSAWIPYRYIPGIILIILFGAWLIKLMAQWKNATVLYRHIVRGVVLLLCVRLISQVIMRIPTQENRYSLTNPRLQILIQLIIVTILMAYFLPPAIVNLVTKLKFWMSLKFRFSAQK